MFVYKSCVLYNISEEKQNRLKINAIINIFHVFRAHNIAITQRSEPCVQLKVDMKPFAEASEDWEPPSVSASTPLISQSYKEQPTFAPAPQQNEKQETQTGFQGMIMNQVCLLKGKFYLYYLALKSHSTTNQFISLKR